MGRRPTGTLDLHGSHYRVRVQVPQHLRMSFQNQHSVTRILPTDSRAHANRLKPLVVSQIIDEIRKAEQLRASGERLKPVDQQMAYAAWIRTLMKGEPDPPDYPVKWWVFHPSQNRREAFSAVIDGQATTIESLLPIYIAECARKPRQDADCERAVKKLVAFLVNQDMPTSFEHVTRRMIGDWISCRVKNGDHWKTINKDLSFCSGLFKHAIRRGVSEQNPCSLQSLPKIRTKTKRAYSKPELTLLLRGGGETWLIESILVLALSGMRADELASLRVRNCQKGIFKLLDTKRGDRNVPIHSRLIEIIQKRCLGKGDDDFVFHEFPTPSNPKIERSQFLSKRFARYRKKLGLDERNGSRQSAIDLHSLRRFFITQADEAGHRKEDIERVVGHRPQSLSIGLYADPMTIEQMRRVVESVQL